MEGIQGISNTSYEDIGMSTEQCVRILVHRYTVYNVMPRDSEKMLYRIKHPSKLR